MQDMGEDPVLCQPCPPAPMPAEAPKVYRIVTAPQPAPQPVRIVRYVTTTRVQPPPPPPYGMQELYSPLQSWESEPGSYFEGAVPAGTVSPPSQGCWDTSEPQTPYQLDSGVDTLRARLMQVEAEAARLQAEADAAEANAAALRANVPPPPRENTATSEGKSEDSSPTPPYAADVSEASQRSVSPTDGAGAPRYIRHDPYAL